MPDAMPASSTECVSHLVGETLTASFAASGFGNRAPFNSSRPTCDLQQKLASASKRILMKKIEFASGSKQSSFQLDNLRAKLTPLNSPSADATNCYKNSNNASGAVATTKGESQKHVDGLPVPKVVLFAPERVKLEWPNVRRIGAGLENMGNTCFLNSVLQCLTYTPPLVNYIFANEHSSKCKQNGFCMMCEIQRHVRRCLDLNGGVVRPYSIFHKLKEIARHLQYGRQEDAHEFLRYVVSAMQTSCLNGYAKLDKLSRETTVVNQMFGGFLRSQVVCLQCKMHSNTFDPFLDISLDVKNASSVPKAFERFVNPEMLDNDNAYSCARCKQKVPAQKRFTIHRPSNVLTLQLKRFDIHRMFGKVTRHIDFPEKLNIRPYMSVKQGDPIMYQLYAVLVHSGMSSNSGHYYCYVKGSDKMWYTMNDNYVQQMSVGRVLDAEAYLLFYIKQKPVGTNNVGLKKPDLKPLPNNVMKREVKSVMNGPTGDSTRELGVPISRPTVIPTPTKTIPPPERKLSPLAGANQREKISFGIKPHGASEKAVYSQKPRIVMHIKKGKVSYSSVSDKPGSVVSPKPQSVATKNSVSNRTLVPYDDDDSDTLPTKGVASSDCREQKRDGEKAVKNYKSFEPVFDEQLNATTAVPGAYGSLDRIVARSVHDVKLKNGSSCDVSKAGQGKLKHKLDECLTVQVDSAATVAKVNATSRWEVQHQDAEAPSSIGSCSSSGSVNSTTKWEVTPQRCPASCEEQLSPLEMAYLAGFTVKSKHDSVADATETLTPLTNGKQTASVVKAATDGRVVASAGNTGSSSVNLAVNSDVGKASSGDASSDTLPGTTPGCNGEKRKHKRHRKKDKREEKEEDDEIPRKKKKHRQKNESQESSSDTPPDGARLSSDASSTSAELVWVEKTKETIEKEHSKHHLVGNADSKVPVQSWDEHLQRAPPGGSASKRQGGKFRHAWDGTKTLNTDVVSQLKRNSLAGYGSKVNSWEGGCSQVDSDIAKERKAERKRRWSDGYEEELDMGKTKKVHNKSHMDCAGDNNGMTFQKVQDYRNTLEKDRVKGTGNFNEGYHRHESKHYRHKSTGSDHRGRLHDLKNRHKLYH